MIVCDRNSDSADRPRAGQAILTMKQWRHGFICRLCECQHGDQERSEVAMSQPLSLPSGVPARR